MNRLVKLLACALAMAMLLSCALADYDPDPNLNEGGVEPICKETVELTIGVPLAWTITDWETNYQTTELERIGNYDLHFVFYATLEEMGQKISMQILSDPDSLPDILMTNDKFSATLLDEWGKAGAVIPLNEYYENCTYYIDQSFETIDFDPLPYVTSPDGNIYGMYKFGQSLANEHQNRMFIYQPWLDALGLDVPTTLEEFYDVLVAFRDEDPNNNGIQDEIPLMTDTTYLGFRSRSLTDFLMSSFVYTNNSNKYFAIDENGQLFAAYASDGWREGLKYLKGLMDEGLFSELSLSTTFDQFKIILNAETTTVGCMTGTVADYMSGTDERRTQYTVMPPLEGPAGRMTSWDPTMPVVTFCITSACKTPEAAFRLGDLLGSRYFSIMTRFGQEGVDWVAPEEGEESLYASMGYEGFIKAISPWAVEQNQWWAQHGPLIWDYSIGAGKVAASNSQLDPTVKIVETLPEYMALVDKSQSIGSLVYNDEELAVVSTYENELLTYAKECFSLFIKGDMSIDDDWDAYIATLNEIGLQQLTEAKQSAYDRMNNK